MPFHLHQNFAIADFQQKHILVLPDFEKGHLLFFSKILFYHFNTSLQKSYKSIILVFGLIFMTFLAFAFIAWICFGTYLEEFNQFGRAFPSIFYVYVTGTINQ